MTKTGESSEIITSTTPDKTEELEFNQLTELKSLSQNHKLYRQSVGGKVYFIKAINKAQGNYAKEKALLEREHTILSGASSKHIVKSYGIFHNDQLGYYLKLDYIEGSSLEKFLQSNPDVKTRTLILNDIFEAIEDLHAQGIVHNDIKPQNFMIRKEGNRAVLVDFGLSDSDSYTEKNQGYTKQYASPEQTSGGETHIPTDIYALGKIIRLIFPHRYAFICRKCRRTNPKHRYQNISEIKSAIATADRARALLLLLPLIIIAAALWWFSPNNHPTATPPEEVNPVIVNDTVFITDTITNAVHKQIVVTKDTVVKTDTIVKVVKKSVQGSTSEYEDEENEEEEMSEAEKFDILERFFQSEGKRKHSDPTKVKRASFKQIEDITYIFEEKYFPYAIRQLWPSYNNAPEFMKKNIQETSYAMRDTLLALVNDPKIDDCKTRAEFEKYANSYKDIIYKIEEETCKWLTSAENKKHYDKCSDLCLITDHMYRDYCDLIDQVKRQTSNPPKGW